MKRRTAACPACAAPVEFKVGSTAVTICEFCQSAVARVDRKIEDYGSVAELIETNTPLRRGLSGKFNRGRFTILGRVQYSHPAGGTWNEWYLSFPGDKWGWLSEAQGKFHLMFSRKLSSSRTLPDFDEMEIGTQIRLGKSEFTLAEKGVAKTLAAEGDIPWLFRPDIEHQFADLTGPDGVFATFEYGDRPAAYVGKEVTLEQLELDDVQVYEEAKIVVPAKQLNCPECAGPLTLHADATQRVTCQSCNSLLDASTGKLQYLMTMRTKERLPIKIPLGSTGVIEGNEYILIGFLQRFAMYQGTAYPWSEYLLYNADIGYRWLVENDKHWSFVQSANASASGRSNSLNFDGDNFRVYDRGTAYVRSVMGEFYWQVALGDETETADFIAPPRMLSYEWSKVTDLESKRVISNERNVSLATYMTVDEVEKVFGITGLRRPWGVGTIQPRPTFGVGVFWMWFGFLVLLLAIHLAFSKPLSAGLRPVDGVLRDAVRFGHSNRDLGLLVQFRGQTMGRQRLQPLRKRLICRTE